MRFTHERSGLRAQRTPPARDYALRVDANAGPAPRPAAASCDHRRQPGGDPAARPDRRRSRLIHYRGRGSATSGLERAALSLRDSRMRSPAIGPGAPHSRSASPAPRGPISAPTPVNGAGPDRLRRRRAHRSATAGSRLVVPDGGATPLRPRHPLVLETGLRSRRLFAARSASGHWPPQRPRTAGGMGGVCARALLAACPAMLSLRRPLRSRSSRARARRRARIAVTRAPLAAHAAPASAGGLWSCTRASAMPPRLCVRGGAARVRRARAGCSMARAPRC
jgi:hypothetical protein